MKTVMKQTILSVLVQWWTKGWQKTVRVWYDNLSSTTVSYHFLTGVEQIPADYLSMVRYYTLYIICILHFPMVCNLILSLKLRLSA